MNTELEAKFLDIDAASIREKLHAVGAVLAYPERLMKRNNFDFSDLRLEKIGGWVRVRDEGDKVTLSYKQVNHRGFTGTQEIEMAVDSYKSACDFLVALGLEKKSYQETRREKWALGNCEVTIDTWPWIPTTLEIEGPTEDEVKASATQLGLPWSNALHGDIAIAYARDFDIEEQAVYHHNNFSFDAPCPWRRR